MKKLSFLLGLGAAIYAIVVARRGTRALIPEPELVPDLDELEIAEDLAALGSELDEDDDPIDEVTLGLDAFARPEAYGNPRAARGSGELYDVHVVDAVDRQLPDEDHANADGETWYEHLEASAGEYGAQPEHVLDVVDGSSGRTDTRDIPVADRGSGGPRGL